MVLVRKVPPSKKRNLLGAQINVDFIFGHKKWINEGLYC
jgi:hypothetical protein